MIAELFLPTNANFAEIFEVLLPVIADGNVFLLLLFGGFFRGGLFVWGECSAYYISLMYNLTVYI